MSKAAAPRRRDAAASRERLLRAAGELFTERGYDRTTSREIGERAGVDPAMIARYFGGKAQLFIACLHAERPGTPADLLDPERLESVLDRTARQGAGPVFQVAVRTFGDAAAQEAAAAELAARIVAPLRDRLLREEAAAGTRADGAAPDTAVVDAAAPDVADREAEARAAEERAGLRAEVLTAAFTGVLLGRRTGSLPRLAAVSTEELLPLVRELLAGGERVPDQAPDPQADAGR